VDPARVRAIEGLRARLLGISEALTGTHGIVIFDPYSSESGVASAVGEGSIAIPLIHSYLN